MNNKYQLIINHYLQILKKVTHDLKSRKDKYNDKLSKYYQKIQKFQCNKNNIIIETCEALHLLYTTILDNFRKFDELTEQDLDQLNDILYEIKKIN